MVVWDSDEGVAESMGKGVVLVGCGRGQNWVVVGADLVSSRLKGWRRVQGWKIGRWGGRYR
jgi:hypothetical protein